MTTQLKNWAEEQSYVGEKIAGSLYRPIMQSHCPIRHKLHSSKGLRSAIKAHRKELARVETLKRQRIQTNTIVTRTPVEFTQAPAKPETPQPIRTKRVVMKRQSIADYGYLYPWQRIAMDTPRKKRPSATHKGNPIRYLDETPQVVGAFDVTIAERKLLKAGFLRSQVPHHLTGAWLLWRNGIRRQRLSGEYNAAGQEYVNVSNVMLTPAAALHCYIRIMEKRNLRNTDWRYTKERTFTALYGDETPEVESTEPITPIELPSTLTERERNLCLMIASGQTDTDIGAALGLDRTTVCRLRKKLAEKPEFRRMMVR